MNITNSPEDGALKPAWTVSAPASVPLSLGQFSPLMSMMIFTISVNSPRM